MTTITVPDDIASKLRALRARIAQIEALSEWRFSEAHLQALSMVIARLAPVRSAPDPF